MQNKKNQPLRKGLKIKNLLLFKIKQTNEINQKAPYKSIQIFVKLKFRYRRIIEHDKIFNFDKFFVLFSKQFFELNKILNLLKTSLGCIKYLRI